VRPERVNKWPNSMTDDDDDDDDDGKIYVFWDVTLCYWTIMSRCFETMLLLHKIEDYSRATQGFFPGVGGVASSTLSP
jgi:hypothetical protein